MRGGVFGFCVPVGYLEGPASQLPGSPVLPTGLCIAQCSTILPFLMRTQLLMCSSIGGASVAPCPTSVRKLAGGGLPLVAVPETRSGGLTNTASRKPARSSASSRTRSFMSVRPWFHVIMKLNMMAPRTSGNQPPSSTFTTLAAKNAKTTRKKKPVAAKHSHHGYFQP